MRRSALILVAMIVGLVVLIRHVNRRGTCDEPPFEHSGDTRPLADHF